MYDEAFRIRSNADGLQLQVYRWTSPQPLGVLVLAHGMAEHALRYDRFARALTGAGFEVYALDHRGHGGSPGPAGLGDFGSAGWSALVADLGQLVAHVRAQHPDLRLALFGHSMGSFAAQQLCYASSSALDALLLSGSTALEVSGKRKRLSLEPNSEFEPARTPYDWLSRDPVEVDNYIADPLCGFEAQTGRNQGSRIDWKQINAPDGPAGIRSDLPVLLLAGHDDPLNRKLEGLRLLEQRWRDAG
ncbi:MAG TPA: alpha/beta fold hydrolase, partial [Polyangiales bacterium]|nr:alpha/beta fold hydrolase [Polyangiales bacterium]